MTPLKVMAQSADPLEAVAGRVGCAYEDILKSDSFTAGDSVSDWLAIAAGCSGNPVRSQAYLKALEEYVTKMYVEEGGLHRIKATEWHRISLTVLALGGDPTCFGTDAAGNEVNLIAEGTYAWDASDSLGLQGLNGWIYALITLDALNYTVPEDALYTRESIISELLAAQEEDGGFGLSHGASDVDITAMTLQALAPYYSKDEEVQNAVERALDWLSGQQTENGDFNSWGEPNAESTAQTIIALCSLGIDSETDERFCKSEHSAVDGLLSYQMESGMFRHSQDGNENVMATEQAALALIALERFDSGASRIYDMREISVYNGEEMKEQNDLSQTIIIICLSAVCIAGIAVVGVRMMRGKKA